MGIKMNINLFIVYSPVHPSLPPSLLTHLLTPSSCPSFPYIHSPICSLIRPHVHLFYLSIIYCVSLYIPLLSLEIFPAVT